MHWLGWVVAALALIEGGWLAFDGGRALIVGDYVTPSSGPSAGQLGPWSKVVSALGIDLDEFESPHPWASMARRHRLLHPGIPAGSAGNAL